MASKGFTWNAVAVEDWRISRRSAPMAGMSAVLCAAVAASGIAIAVHRTVETGAPVGVGTSVWFADPNSSPDGEPTLPDLASVEQVIGAPTAWAAGGRGQGIDVAVLDSGVTPVQGLNAPNKVVYGPDLSFDSQDPSKAYLDGYGHGTAMASIIAGNDGTPGGFKGVAPDARIVSVKVGAANGAVDVSQIIAGIDWVVQHAHDPGMNIRVLNISLGTDTTQSYVLDPLAHAAEVAWRHGIVVVASVGNDGMANKTVADPAMDPYVLAVGSEDPMGTIDQSDDVVSPFSSRGSIFRHPDIVAPGSYIVGLRDPGSYLDTNYPDARIGDRFFRGSGTSQAAAVVSGVVADLLSARPKLDPDRTKRLLKKTAADISTGRNNLVGAGLVDAAAALTTGVSQDFAQDWPTSTGLGSLEAARGSSHVASNGVMLTGERDILGNTWTAATMASAEENAATWSGGTYNGATWSGATWSAATWSGATWSGNTWSGATWSAATWSGATWSGATWSGATWSGATWSGATWSSNGWS